MDTREHAHTAADAARITLARAGKKSSTHAINIHEVRKQKYFHFQVILVQNILVIFNLFPVKKFLRVSNWPKLVKSK